MNESDDRNAANRAWMESPRFERITRLYSARDVAALQGTIRADYTVARTAAEDFYARLTQLFEQRRHTTTFGPYSPGQAVAMKRMGIESIYLGGWATSAKGSINEDPGPDLASYPLSQVPDEAAVLVRALLTADKNQHFLRQRMTDEQRATTPEVDFRPFIIADADTGHGGDAHVRNLVRRFVEVGVPGYHIEDQKPGAKKCGHQAGKVLVSSDEQIKRLNAARLQLDIMRVPGIIVARTDAEAATLLDNPCDERDQPFILGATSTALPSYRSGYASVLRRLADLKVSEVRGHLLFAVSDSEYRAACEWLDQTGLTALIQETAKKIGASPDRFESLLDALEASYSSAWQSQAGMKTYGEAVADEMTRRGAEGQKFATTAEEWSEFAKTASFYDVRAAAVKMGLQVTWDCEHARTSEGYYHVRGGIEYAIAKSLAAAPFADLLWMETKTADLHDARIFAEAIHARYPKQMLAYNLSPSFNWDTTGMSDESMRQFPEELGKLGFVFNFITYGGHQADGLAGEDFAAALRQDGMLALARLQRKFRLLDSPYRTPQTLVGGPRLDAALMMSSGRTAATKAMAQGSTQFQHLAETEVPPKALEEWLVAWRAHNEYPAPLRVELRPFTAGSDLLYIRVLGENRQVLADVVFTPLQDRNGRTIVAVRDQNTVAAVRRRRLMTLVQLFLIDRYKASVIHFMTPTDDNVAQATSMKAAGIFESINTGVGQIIVADVAREKVSTLLRDQKLIDALIRKGARQPLSAAVLAHRG